MQLPRLEHTSLGMGRDGHRRGNPRIKGDDVFPTTRSSRLKRKFEGDGDCDAAGVSKLAKQVWKGRDGSTDCAVFWRSSCEENGKQHRDENKDGRVSVMPEKHVLELVLDTLQRRDTYEIFAEPVNPDEVEDYYEIIKEPMDFGTMRAKLHEGLYENLQQFEHDVFLIPENAMHFNSSATTYFRQARAILELAKKVFDALKKDPENFVLEFSGTRRRSMRKALSETKDSRLQQMDIKSGNVGADGFPRGTSTFRRSSKKTSGCHCTNDHGFGSRDGQMPSFKAAEKRLTYNRAMRPSLVHNIASSTESFHIIKQLLPMNQGDYSYRNSLMSFVKDLGPTAQMVARRKLLGEHKSIYRTVSNIIDLTEDREEAKGEGPSAGKGKTDTTLRSCNKATTSIAKTEAAAGNQRSNKLGRGLRSEGGGKSEDNVRPVILALESAHSKGGGPEYKPRNKKSSSTSTSTTVPWRRGGQKEDVEAKIKSPTGGAKPCTPLTNSSQFAFGLPFLKARLDKMHAVGMGGDRLKRPLLIGGEGGVERAAAQGRMFP